MCYKDQPHHFTWEKRTNFFLFKTKESVRPNGRRRRVKSRTSTPPLSSDQSNAETTKRLWFWLRSVNERKFKDEEKIRDRKFWTLLQNKLTSFLRTRKRPPFIPILVILKLVTLVFDDDAAEARVDARGRFRLDVLLCCWHFLLFFSDVFPEERKRSSS